MKERLEEISNLLERYYSTDDSFEQTDLAIEIIQGHVNWIINRVEELELEVNDWREEVQKWQKFYKESEESHLETKELLKSIVNQNKRYREALEFYADEKHYKEKLISEAQYDADGICISNDEYAPPIIYFDSGELARQALEGDEN